MAETDSPEFSSDRDQLPRRSLSRRSVAIGALSFIAVLIGSFGYVTNFFTKADLGSLPAEELQALNRIRQAGVRVETRPMTGFGSPAHIVPEATWRYSMGQATITSVTVFNAEVQLIAAELKEFANLKEVRIPQADARELDRVRKQLPNVQRITN